MKPAALLALCGALVLGTAHAAGDAPCPAEVEDALRDFAPQTNAKTQTSRQGPAVSAHCKPWPPSGGQMLAAVMAFEQGTDDNRRWAGVLALVDTRSGRVAHGRTFQIEQDAVTTVGDGSLRLDTAPYVLAPGVRALGLRYASAGPGASAANSRRGDELTLFVPDGRGLRPVLGLSMSLSEAVTGLLGNRPDAIWDDATRTVAIGPAGPQGWADLRVTATVVRDGPEQDTTLDRRPQRRLQVYRYNGRHYTLLSSQFDWDDGCCTVGWPPR